MIYVVVFVVFFFFFFFSSRRRHTRFSRDWSSDVCSSDLSASDFPEARSGRIPSTEGLSAAEYTARVGIGDDGALQITPLEMVQRSEERRVGKECRSRWSAYH